MESFIGSQEKEPDFPSARVLFEVQVFWAWVTGDQIVENTGT